MSACEQRLREEQEMANYVDGSIERVTHVCVEKATTGEEGGAGVM